MNKRHIPWFLILMFVLISILKIGIADEYITYHVTNTDMYIDLPESWIFTDRDVQDDSPICQAFNVNKEYIMNSFLDDEHTFLWVIDPYSSLSLSTDIYPVGLRNFSEFTDDEIRNLSSKIVDNFTNGGFTILSTSILRYNVPFFKVVRLSEDNSISYYYTTVHSEKQYIIEGLFVDSENGPKLEDELDKCIASIAFDREKKPQTDNSNIQNFSFDSFFLHANPDYTYTLREDANKSYTEQFSFSFFPNLRAMISYNDFLANVYHYPKVYETSLSEDKCKSEIVKYADSLAKDPAEIVTIGNNGYYYQTMSHVGNANIEYIDFYIFHKNGIVKIETNHHYESQKDHEQLINFVFSIANDFYPLSTMPK